MIAGLKPYPEYKNSGLPWLGQAPRHCGMRQAKVLLREQVEKGFPNEPLLAATQSKGVVHKEGYGTRTVTAHWEITRVKKRITTVEQGWSPQCDNQPAGIDEWGVLKVGCVNKCFFNEGQNKKLPPALHPEPSLEISDGDIFVSRANTRELLGLAALAENPRPRLLLCDKLFRFRARPDSFVPRYLIHVLRSKPSRAQIESSTNGASSSMQNIGQSVLKNLWIAIPPTEEQQKIVDAILKDTADLEVATTRIEREINLLREAAAQLPQVEDAPADKIGLAELEESGEELAEENI